MDTGTKINKLTGKINTMNEHRKMRYNLITEPLADRTEK